VASSAERIANEIAVVQWRWVARACRAGKLAVVGGEGEVQPVLSTPQLWKRDQLGFEAERGGF